MRSYKSVWISVQILLFLVWITACTFIPSDRLTRPSLNVPAQTDSRAGLTPPEVSLTPTLTPFQPAFSVPGPGSALATIQPVDDFIPAAGTEQSSSSPEVRKLWLDPNLPEQFRASLTLSDGIILVEEPDQASVRLEYGLRSPTSQWIYALVTPFPSLVDSLSSNNLRRAWAGEADGPFAGKPLLVDSSTHVALRVLWGEPASQAVMVLPKKELLSFAWKNQPSWAVIPFEDLEPRWKVLEVDGQSPLYKDFDPATYSLNVPISLNGDLVMENPAGILMAAPTNRLPERLTVLVMTGVTALVRSTAFAMEQKGIQYPAGGILQWLKEADLTHISNEVSFAKDCPPPDPFQSGTKFCSLPLYIDLLEAIGTDIVELTGDHIQDWGAAAMNQTIDMYQERGWLTYGGGKDIDLARQAITVEHNGNRLAWIGCNAKGGSYAQASANSPGAAPCDLAWMESEVTRLRNEGYLPIVTFQHFEYYTYQAQPDQKRDFRRMAQAGAVIVSGSQAHQPQAIEFSHAAFIHYGLGNLFFDQFEVSLATRQAFIDRHIFYDGRYLGTELLTGMFVDYAKMRPMTAPERKALLKSIFVASGW